MPVNWNFRGGGFWTEILDNSVLTRMHASSREPRLAYKSIEYAKAGEDRQCLVLPQG